MENLNYAGFGWRLLAIIIDSILITIVGCVIGAVVGIAFGVGLAATGADKHAMMMILNVVSYIFGILLSWLYHALMESSPWQATLGKRICKITVTDMDGERLTFLRATGRHFAKIISGLTCYVGFIMAGFTARKQALHDMIASTLVLREVE